MFKLSKIVEIKNAQRNGEKYLWIRGCNFYVTSHLFNRGFNIISAESQKISEQQQMVL